jgi:hypothetical protein
MKHIACSGIGLVLLLGLTGVPAGAQNQAPAASQTSSSGSSSAGSSSSGSSSSGSSLGDYARQVRKDPGTAPSKPKVFDNDNLPKVDKLSVVGRTPASASDSSPAQSETPAPAANEAKGTSEAKTESQVKLPSNNAAPAPDDEAAKAAASKQWADKLATQKDQIDLLGRELDVLQREYQIRAAAMYADAGNRMRNSADWDKQDTQYKQQIADKQKALDEAKQKLEDTQEEARKAGVPASVREP